MIHYSDRVQSQKPSHPSLDLKPRHTLGKENFRGFGHLALNSRSRQDKEGILSCCGRQETGKSCFSECLPSCVCYVFSDLGSMTAMWNEVQGPCLKVKVGLEWAHDGQGSPHSVRPPSEDEGRQPGRSG